MERLSIGDIFSSSASSADWARYYDPELGRFLSEDPIGITGGLNLYAYAGNDPVNRWDPTGLDPAEGPPCTMEDGRPGKLNKQGVCEPTKTVTLPDIPVQSEPPTDIVTIQRGQRSTSTLPISTYPVKGLAGDIFKTFSNMASAPPPPPPRELPPSMVEGRCGRLTKSAGQSVVADIPIGVAATGRPIGRIMGWGVALVGRGVEATPPRSDPVAYSIPLFASFLRVGDAIAGCLRPTMPIATRGE